MQNPKERPIEPVALAPTLTEPFGLIATNDEAFVAVAERNHQPQA